VEGSKGRGIAATLLVWSPGRLEYEADAVMMWDGNKTIQD
jgi:hypothetical protein